MRNCGCAPLLSGDSTAARNSSRLRPCSSSTHAGTHIYQQAAPRASERRAAHFQGARKISGDARRLSVQDGAAQRRTIRCEWQDRRRIRFRAKEQHAISAGKRIQHAHRFRAFPVDPGRSPAGRACDQIEASNTITTLRPSIAWPHRGFASARTSNNKKRICARNAQGSRSFRRRGCAIGCTLAQKRSVETFRCCGRR